MACFCQSLLLEQLACSKFSWLPKQRPSAPFGRYLHGRVCCFHAMAGNAPGSSKTVTTENDTDSAQKRVYVAGATGNTGTRIVKTLLSKGFEVKAGVRDLEKAKSILPYGKEIEFVQADVTESSDKLAKAIGSVSAVICATGFRPSFDFLAPWKVDNFGTVHLVDACKKLGVRRFVLVSSILVNGAAKGQLFNPAYIVLNIFGLTLIAKLQAEQYIRQSGINYTIIRPGGLRNDSPNGNIIMASEDTLFEGSISRDDVAEVAVESLLCPESSYKVVEIVSRVDALKKPICELFTAIN